MVAVKSRRLGEDNGRDLLLNLAGQVRKLSISHREVHRKLTPEEHAALERTRSKYRTEEPSPFSHVKF
jgi:hypothetical protein